MNHFVLKCVSCAPTYISDGTPPQSSATIVNVTIQGTQLQLPEFRALVFEGNVAENAENGTHVDIQVCS